MSDTIRIGMFGAWRGTSYIDLIAAEDPSVIKIVAVCDKHANMLDCVKGLEEAKGFTDFDEFLEYGKSVGMNAVFLANYFHQLAEFAIKAMEAGMDVVSECTAAATLRECVELVECVERTGRRYMLAENYPYMTANLKMNELVKSGKCGTLLYAEGEYNHSGSNEELARLTPGKNHWRAYLPRTSYLTHAMGPLLFMTDSMPLYVSARAAHSDLLAGNALRHNYDGTAILFCELSNGTVARFTGCTAMASDYSRYRVVGDRASTPSPTTSPRPAV